MDPRSTNYLRQNMFSHIPGDDTSFFFFISFSFSFGFLLFYVIISFYENYFFIIIFFFFMKIILIFSCSGMFRNVPECSMFRVLSTPILIHGSTQIIRQSHSIDSNVDLFMYLIEAEGLGSVC